MKLTKKIIEKRFNVRLERGDFNMSDNYKSWHAWKYIQEDNNEILIAWCDTLQEIVDELKTKSVEMKE